VTRTCATRSTSSLYNWAAGCGVRSAAPGRPSEQPAPGDADPSCNGGGRAMARSDLSKGDEGTYVGAIGAGSVALWFFVSDLIQGHPLRTPSVLGQVLLFGESRPDLTHVQFAAVIAYTAVHFAV